MKTLELQSQQLADVLLQLGFVPVENESEHDYEDEGNSVFDYDYIGNELNVYWDVDGDCVFNANENNYSRSIERINRKSIATNIAYFQKQLNEKLNQGSQNENN